VSTERRTRPGLASPLPLPPLPLLSPPPYLEALGRAQCVLALLEHTGIAVLLGEGFVNQGLHGNSGGGGPVPALMEGSHLRGWEGAPRGVGEAVAVNEEEEEEEEEEKHACVRESVYVCARETQNCPPSSLMPILGRPSHLATISSTGITKRFFPSVKTSAAALPMLPCSHLATISSTGITKRFLPSGNSLEVKPRSASSCSLAYSSCPD
jgi:hypothetical protein